MCKGGRCKPKKHSLTVFFRPNKLFRTIKTFYSTKLLPTQDSFVTGFLEFVNVEFYCIFLNFIPAVACDFGPVILKLEKKI